MLSWNEGRRIVELAVLAENLHCKQCSSLLDLSKTVRETRQGLASVLYIVCSCGVANDVHTSSKQRAANGKLAFGVNIMASAGGIMIYWLSFGFC